MSYFPDTAQGIAADALPNAASLSGSNILVLRQGGVDVQTTLTALQTFLGAGAAAFPGAPGVPMAGTSTSSSITLSWSAPTSGGAAASYLVQQSATGAAAWATAATPAGTSVTVTGLAAGTGYDFRVAGVNASGTGAYSSVLSNASTAAPSAPNAVTGLAASAATASTITLSWTESGGAASTRTVTYRIAGSGSYAAVPGGTFTATGGTVTGLAASTAYDFQVVESNATGSSGAATLANVSTTVAAPGAVTGLAKGTVTGTTAVLSWTNAAGATGWSVAQRTPPGSGSYVTATLSAAATATGATITGLATGSSYDFQVVASNAGGSGPAATLSGVLTSPAAVTMLTAASIGTTTAALTWTNATGAASWIVTQRTPSGSGSYVAATLSVAASAGGATVSGLTTGSSYDFQVVASNATGSGPAATLTGVTPGAVGQVTGVALGTPTSTTLPITWTAPSGGSSPSGYLIELSSNGGSSFGTPITVNSTDIYYVVTGLAASTSYVARVRGFNGAGNGPVSAVSGAVTTLGASDAFATLAVSSTATAGTGFAATYTTNQTTGYLAIAQAGAEWGGSAERIFQSLSTSGGTLPSAVILPAPGTYTVRLYNGSNAVLLAESRPIVAGGTANPHDYTITAGGTAYTVTTTPVLPTGLARASALYLTAVVKAAGNGAAVTSGVYYYWSTSASTQVNGSIVAGSYGADSSFHIHLDTYTSNANSTRYLWLYVNGNWAVVDGAGVVVP